MMNEDCRRTASRLASYVDDLLPSAERADVEQHLRFCPPCRTAALSERCARVVLRDQASALSEVPVPPRLRSRCEALAREHGARPRRRFAFQPFAPVTAVMTVVVGIFVFALATHRSDTVLAAQLTVDHAKCLRLFAAGASANEDAHRVEQMLEHDYGWNVHVPPSSAAKGVHLVGARRCLYADGFLPHVMYRVDGHDVSLYMLDGVARRAADIVALGHRSHIWSRGRRTYVLVWPAAGGEMPDALRYVVAEAR